MTINLEQLKAAIQAKGYTWFETGDYNLNIIGIRNASTGNKVTNLFDDWIACAYKVNGEWQLHYWEATTDPGKMGVEQYHNPQGVARLVEGQYGKSHVIGLHQGKYEALCQIAPLPVYRDANRDLVFDKTKITTGVYGINIHKAGVESWLVENWSEGCQVFKRAAEFNQFMLLCKEAVKRYGNKFTYTLINSEDLS